MRLFLPISIKASQLTRKGFTIVEMVVVVAVVGILVTIGTIAYNGIQDQSRTVALKSDLTNIPGTLELFKKQSATGTYPATIEAANLPVSNGITYQYYSDSTTTPVSYCVTGTVKSTSFYVSNANIRPSVGACPGHGVNGVPAITNLVKNPQPSSSYWFPSSTSVGTTSFISVGGIPTVRSTRVSTGNYALYSNRSDPVIANLEANETYTVLFRISSNATTNVVFQVGTGTATASIASLARPISLTAGATQTIRHVFTTPTANVGAAAFNKIYWVDGEGAVGDYIDISRMMWVKGAYYGAFADGASSSWRWNGEPNASTSTGPPK